MYTVFKNQRNSSTLCIDGHKYTLKRKNIAEVVWRCTERRSGCQAIVKTP
jgi:hypothetical protein